MSVCVRERVTSSFYSFICCYCCFCIHLFAITFAYVAWSDGRTTLKTSQMNRNAKTTTEKSTTRKRISESIFDLHLTPAAAVAVSAAAAAALLSLVATAAAMAKKRLQQQTIQMTRMRMRMEKKHYATRKNNTHT